MMMLRVTLEAITLTLFPRVIYFFRIIVKVVFKYFDQKHFYFR